MKVERKSILEIMGKPLGGYEVNPDNPYMVTFKDDKNNPLFQVSYIDFFDENGFYFKGEDGNNFTGDKP